MATPRPIRIVRGSRGPPAAGAAVRETSPSERMPPPPKRASIEEEADFNRAGIDRANRLFVLFGGAIALLYALFVGLELTSPTPGVNGNAVAIGSFTVGAAVILFVAWYLTLHRAPRAVAVRDEMILVIERSGRIRRYAGTGRHSPRVVQRNPGSFLSRSPTELVELTGEGLRPRVYLLGEGMIPQARDEVTG